MGHIFSAESCLVIVALGFALSDAYGECCAGKTADTDTERLVKTPDTEAERRVVKTPGSLKGAVKHDL